MKFKDSNLSYFDNYLFNSVYPMAHRFVCPALKVLHLKIEKIIAGLGGVRNENRIVDKRHMITKLS